MMVAFLKLAIGLGFTVNVENSTNVFKDYNYPVECWVLDSSTVCKVSDKQIIVFI